MKQSPWFLSFVLILLSFGHADSVSANLEKLSFLEGCWKGEDKGSVVYESWGNSDGNVMLGASKTVSAGRLESFEFLSVVVKDEKILYMPYINGTNTVSFSLVQSEDATAEFSNPAHDFPKSIRYERQGKNLLVLLKGDGPNVEYKMVSVACQ